MFTFGLDDLTTHARVVARLPKGIETKDQLLRELAVQLAFPDYYGGNWDALEECIRDLSWLPPGQVVVSHGDIPMRSDEKSQAIYLSILHDATEEQEARGRELVVGFPDATQSEIQRLLETDS